MSKAAELANLIGNINAGGGGVNRNVIINGAMNIAQRSTSETGVGASAGYFTCDRWRITLGGDASAGRFTMSQDSSAPNGFTNSLKIDCTTDDTSIAASERLMLLQRIEGQNLQAFAKGTADAKPFAVSFYVKGNASATYVCELYDNDNNRQISKTFNVTTDWERVELTYPADTTGTFDDDNAISLFLVIWLHAGSNYTSGTLNSSSWASNTQANRVVGISSFFDSTDRTFFLTGVQLEVGQNPTSFEHEPFEKTLDKCHRYYWKIGASTENEQYYRYGNHGESISSSQAQTVVQFPKKMRAQPSLTENGDIRWYSNGSIIEPSGACTVDGNAGGTYATNMVNGGLSGLTTGRAGIFLSNNNTTSNLEWDAEL
tara:strand:+ start:192 stop:1310 length:1119 start_codon:yes stop_codon:yes gene_type:complete